MSEALWIEDAALGEGRVRVGHALQRQSHRLDDEVVHRQLIRARPVLWRTGVEALARVEQRVDLAVHVEAEMRDGGRRLGEPLRDGFAHVVERADFVAALLVKCQDLIVGHRRREGARRHQRLRPVLRRQARGGCFRRLPHATALRAVHVVLDDAAMRATALHRRKIDACASREPARKRRGEDAAMAVRLRWCKSPLTLSLSPLGRGDAGIAVSAC